jgi:predicted metal-dependent HD superfamily phosphohydrolase
MNTTNSNILNETAEYVKELLTTKLPDEIEFHKIDHTEYVVKCAEYLGKNTGLDEQQLTLLQLSAWFHDTGYTVEPENHENESARIAAEFLDKKGVEKDEIEVVKKAIIATSIPQNPTDDISRILCDADLMHVAEEDYIERIDNMRREMAKLTGEKVGRRKFYKMSVQFFEKHQYHTEFARKELEPKKEKNIQLLKKEIHMLEQQKEKKLMEQELSKKKPKGYSRGVESMFRLTARNQINLSSIADNKSNILISVNAIIMSISMTVLVTRFEEVPNIILPTLIFLLFCLITIIFAILSTRPNISSGTFTKEDIEENKVNLLFFGNFYNMTLDDYEWGINQLMKNDENLYGTMIKDQYALGKVLAKKYKLLRIAYNVFMVGIIISVLAFVLAFTNF